MSNYLSRPYQPSQPISMMPDMNLALNTIDTLQTRYDANKAATDQIISQFENLRGERDIDNQYIAAKVNQVKGLLNGNIRYEHASSSAHIRKSAMNIVQDPIVRDAILSRQVIQNFDAEAAKRKEKNDGSYNDVNYQYSKEQGGYYDYMAGKTNKLSNLSYIPYTDVQTNYTNRLKEYVKQYDDEQYIRTENSKYQTVDIYGKKILKSDLEKFLITTTTPQEAQQLQINAWYKYKGLDADGINKTLQPIYKKEVENLNLIRAEVKAKADTGDDEAKKTLTKIDDIIKEKTLKSQKSDYTKTDLYNHEISTFISDMASLYDKDIITKRDTDNLPFEVLKFETETALKVREVEAAEKANKLTEQQMTGDIVPRETPDEEEELTDYQKAQKATLQTATALDMYLNQNVEGYKNMTPDAQWQYKLNFNPSDLTIKGNKDTALVLANNFKDAQKAQANIVNKVGKDVELAVKTSFDSLIGGKANLGNLKYTMPLTAVTLQSRQGLTFDSLTEEERAGLTAEWIANKMQFSPPSSDDLKNVYKSILVHNKSKVNKSEGRYAKTVSNLIKNNTDTIEASTNLAIPLAKLGFNLLKNKGIDKVINTVGGVFNAISQGKDYAREEYSRNMQQDEQDYQKTKKEAQTSLKRGALDYLPFEDTNITELEARDLAVRNGRTSKDIAGIFSTLDDTAATTIKNNSAKYQANIKDFNAFNFSTENKLQEDTAQKIRAAVLNVPDLEAMPKQTNDYTISREGGNYRVDYTDVDDKRVSVLVPKIAPSIVEMIDTKKADWLRDPANKEINLTPMVFKPITTPSESQKRIEALVENVGNSGIIPLDVLQGMRANPAGTPLASVSDNIESVKTKYGADFYNKNKEKIENIFTEDYTTVPYSTGTSFKVRVDYKEEGKTFAYYPNVEIPTKDDVTLFLIQLNAIAELKEKRIKQLK